MKKIIKEINVKSILTTSKKPEAWFGVKYNMNIYRGCEYQCIYCDSRSECYRIEDFTDVLVKINAEEILNKELSSKRIKGIIGTGAMSDPYTFAEKKYELTRKALKLISLYNFPVNIVTKSDLIVRDLDILKLISRNYASVAFTLTTTDDTLARKIEPFAPSPSRRLKAMKELSIAGIYTGVTMMPILPFIEDSKENIELIIKNIVDCGGKYVIPWFGVSLRDRQRLYFYNKLDESFPGIKDRYEKSFGNNYVCSSPKYKELIYNFNELCDKYRLINNMEDVPPKEDIHQLSLF